MWLSLKLKKIAPDKGAQVLRGGGGQQRLSQKPKFVLFFLKASLEHSRMFSKHLELTEPVFRHVCIKSKGNVSLTKGNRNRN